jgi:tetratricopeptide (TPR) repeat protein
MISNFFGKKPAGGDGTGSNQPEYAPEKAEKFFQHARVGHESGNYEYAMQLWLRGLQLDPRMVSGLEGFVASAAQYVNSPEGKKRSSKETRTAISGSGEINKFLLALLDWTMSVDDKSSAAAAAVKACEAIVNLNAGDTTRKIGEWAYAAARNDPKPRKDNFVRLMRALDAMGLPDLALNIGEDARRIDPADGQLSNDLKMLAAKSTMAKGGYEKTGVEGGFRQNIRDAGKQKALEEADRVSKTDDAKDRVVAACEAEFAARPEDIPTTDKLIKALRERGKPSDEERAVAISLQTFERTKIFKFRQNAGEVRIRQARRKVSSARQMLESAPGDETVKSIYETERQALLELEVQELKLCVENYPTDLTWKYELGRRYFELGNFEEAIGQFQEAQNDPRVRGRVLHMLGLSFLRCDLADEAVETLRRALEVPDMTPEDQRDIRYDLCCALQINGETRRDLTAAEEAEKIASQILIQAIGYKDIKARRETLKKLVAELRAK